jgi:4-hydroxybenzoate polyprenyltransferase
VKVASPGPAVTPRALADATTGYDEAAGVLGAAPAHAVGSGDAASLPRSLVWALVAPTSHRMRMGEGALLAINLSLIVYQPAPMLARIMGAIVSVLAIGLMYVLNDLHDAEDDRHNPKKDQRLVALYLKHRRLCYGLVFLLKAVTIALAALTLGSGVAAMVTAVFLVNIFYSTVVKGVPVIDVVTAGIWGGLYVAIVCVDARLVVLATLMTAVCHLYQALDDKDADTKTHVRTTAVASQRLSVIVFGVLSVLTFATMRSLLGAPLALTAIIPLALALALRNPRTGWLLTKLYYGIIWLVAVQQVSTVA